MSRPVMREMNETNETFVGSSEPSNSSERKRAAEKKDDESPPSKTSRLWNFVSTPMTYLFKSAWKSNITDVEEPEEGEDDSSETVEIIHIFPSDSRRRECPPVLSFDDNDEENEDALDVQEIGDSSRCPVDPTGDRNPNSQRSFNIEANASPGKSVTTIAGIGRSEGRIAREVEEDADSSSSSGRLSAARRPHAKQPSLLSYPRPPAATFPATSTPDRWRRRSGPATSRRSEQRPNHSVIHPFFTPSPMVRTAAAVLQSAASCNASPFNKDARDAYLRLLTEQMGGNYIPAESTPSSNNRRLQSRRAAQSTVPRLKRLGGSRIPMSPRKWRSAVREVMDRALPPRSGREENKGGEGREEERRREGSEEDRRGEGKEEERRREGSEEDRRGEGKDRRGEGREEEKGGEGVLSGDSGSSPASSTRSFATPCNAFTGLDSLVARIERVHLRTPVVKFEHEQFRNALEVSRERVEDLIEDCSLLEKARHAKEANREAERRRKFALQGIFIPPPKKVELEFPELSAEAKELCRRVWGGGSPDERFVDGAAPLTRKDLCTLSGLHWLNDEVINGYLEMICQRSGQDESYPKVYAFNTFFYANLSSKGYCSVKRWTRKVDVFSFDILLVPVHLSMHWCMAVIDLTEKRIDYFDSLGGNNPNCLPLLQTYLKEESRDKKKEELSLDGWQLTIRKDIPHQLNGSDCGVFSCKFADFAARRKEIIFDQSHMKYYRERMVFQLVKRNLAAF